MGSLKTLLSCGNAAVSPNLLSATVCGANVVESIGSMIEQHALHHQREPAIDCNRAQHDWDYRIRLERRGFDVSAACGAPSEVGWRDQMDGTFSPDGLGSGQIPLTDQDDFCGLGQEDTVSGDILHGRAGSERIEVSVGTQYCSACGAAMKSEEARYCWKCGEKLSVVAQTI